MITALFATALFLGCDENKNTETKTDSETSASQKANSWLPEENDTYEIIGYRKGLKGFTVKYSDDLYRGGNLLSLEGGKLLQKLGVKTVISVTPDETVKTISNSLNLKTIDLFYDYGKLTDSITNEFLSIIDNEEPPFYIHCYSGKQRAGLLCAIYRLHKDNWSFENAEKEYEQLGGKVQEDHGLFVQAEIVVKGKITK